MVHQQEIQIRTSRHGQMHDLTEKVAAIVAQSGIRVGMRHQAAPADGHGDGIG
jgi:thiamine phosphate synthase YjbQ (UPF0047 family)